MNNRKTLFLCDLFLCAVSKELEKIKYKIAASPIIKKSDDGSSRAAALQFGINALR